MKTGFTFALQFFMLISDGLGGVFLLLFHMQHFSFLECSSPLGQIICYHSLTHIASKIFLIESCGRLFLLLWDFGRFFGGCAVYSSWLSCIFFNHFESYLVKINKLLFFRNYNSFSAQMCLLCIALIKILLASYYMYLTILNT